MSAGHDFASDSATLKLWLRADDGAAEEAR
jgi:hypothetical protein